MPTWVYFRGGFRQLNELKASRQVSKDIKNFRKTFFGGKRDLVKMFNRC